jgi:hypothetical protein
VSESEPVSAANGVATHEHPVPRDRCGDACTSPDRDVDRVPLVDPRPFVRFDPGVVHLHRDRFGIVAGLISD